MHAYIHTYMKYFAIRSSNLTYYNHNDLGQKYRRTCNDSETSLEIEMNAERKRMSDIQRNMEDKVKTIPYYMDRKVEKVTKKFNNVKKVARYIPLGNVIILMCFI